MDFYTCSDSSDIKADLPITQYKGEITEVTRLDDGTITFTESLPLGNQQQRLISSDSIFLGTIEKARLFYPSQLVFVGDVSAAQTLFFRHLEKPESESSNKESNPQPTPEIQQKMNTSVNILKRFSDNLNDARISEREGSYTRTLEKQLRDLQEEYRLLEAKQQKLTSDHEALIQLKEEISLGHLSDTRTLEKQLRDLQEEYRLLEATPEIQQKMNTSVNILKRFSDNLNDARISEREGSYTRTLEKQLRDLQEEYRLLEAKQQKLTSDHEALIQLKEEISLGHLSDTRTLEKQLRDLQEEYRLLEATPEIQQQMNTSVNILKRFSDNLNDARISEREGSYTRTLEKQLRDLQEEYRLLEAKQQKLTSDHEA